MSELLFFPSFLLFHTFKNEKERARLQKIVDKVREKKIDTVGLLYAHTLHYAQSVFGNPF